MSSFRNHIIKIEHFLLHVQNVNILTAAVT